MTTTTLYGSAAENLKAHSVDTDADGLYERTHRAYRLTSDFAGIPSGVVYRVEGAGFCRHRGEKYLRIIFVPQTNPH